MRIAAFFVGSIMALGGLAACGVDVSSPPQHSIEQMLFEPDAPSPRVMLVRITGGTRVVDKERALPAHVSGEMRRAARMADSLVTMLERNLRTRAAAQQLRSDFALLADALHRRDGEALANFARGKVTAAELVQRISSPNSRASVFRAADGRLVRLTFPTATRGQSMMVARTYSARSGAFGSFASEPASECEENDPPEYCQDPVCIEEGDCGTYDFDTTEAESAIAQLEADLAEFEQAVSYDDPHRTIPSRDLAAAAALMLVDPDPCYSERNDLYAGMVTMGIGLGIGVVGILLKSPKVTWFGIGMAAGAAVVTVTSVDSYRYCRENNPAH